MATSSTGYTESKEEKSIEELLTSIPQATTVADLGQQLQLVVNVLHELLCSVAELKADLADAVPDAFMEDDDAECHPAFFRPAKRARSEPDDL